MLLILVRFMGSVNIAHQISR